MMLAAGMPGQTTIKIAATEPHVEDLGRFLVAMGADIQGSRDTHASGDRNKHAPGHRTPIIPDANEAATFSDSRCSDWKRSFTVRHAREEHLDIVSGEVAGIRS
jgi:UDP-N-acetylglucosamine enolpyruvyl transferase